MNKNRFPNARCKFHIQMHGENLPVKILDFLSYPQLLDIMFYILNQKFP